MAHLARVVVAQILKAPEVGHFARREERIRAEVARQERQRIVRDGHALRLVGDGLLDVVRRAIRIEGLAALLLPVLSGLPCAGLIGLLSGRAACGEYQSGSDFRPALIGFRACSRSFSRWLGAALPAEQATLRSCTISQHASLECLCADVNSAYGCACSALVPGCAGRASLRAGECAATARLAFLPRELTVALRRLVGARGSLLAVCAVCRCVGSLAGAGRDPCWSCR